MLARHKGEPLGITAVRKDRELSENEERRCGL